MEANHFKNIKFENFEWINTPHYWEISSNKLTFSTDNKTDFWQGTWYNFFPNTGHMYGIEIKDDYTLSVCVEADFTTLYDQAGLMIYGDEKHWLKAGIEYNDGQPMIGSVFTNQVSDWATGVYPGNPKKFYLRLSKKGNVVCVKYSTDNATWNLLRLCSMPPMRYIVGPMACTPQRDGLRVQFTELSVTVPQEDILHSN